MSHFMVLVIGSDPDKQLEKYDEGMEYPEYRASDVDDFDKARFLCCYLLKETEDLERRFVLYMKGKKGNVSEKDYYDKHPSQTGDFNSYYNFLKYENKQHFANFLKSEEPKIWSAFDDLYETKGEDWNYKRWHKEADGKYGEYSRYNPNSKWDWYQMGGRYRGRLKLKKPDPQAPLYSGWQYNDKSGDVAKLKAEGYCDQALAKDISNLDDIKTFAVVKDGEWYEQGEMLYWAAVSNEKDADDWDAEVKSLLRDLPGDTLITVMDCHI